VTAQPEGVQEGEGGKFLRAELPGLGAETLEENIKRRPVVEAVDPVGTAAGHEHGLADRPPAVLHADPERAGGGDAGRDHGAGQNAIAVELECPGHLQPVARAAADHGDAGAENGISAADDLVLVAGQAIGEKQHDAMGMARGRGQAAHRAGAGAAKILRRPGRRRRVDDEAVPAKSADDDAAVTRAVPGDLAGGRAADQRYAT